MTGARMGLRSHQRLYIAGEWTLEPP